MDRSKTNYSNVLQNGMHSVQQLKKFLSYTDSRASVLYAHSYQLFATPLTIAHQDSLSMAVSRQKYWSGLPFLTPGELPDPGIEPRSPTLHIGALPTELHGNT